MMTAVTENFTTLPAAESGFFDRLKDQIARRRIYKRTHAELSALSTRELDDLGISRSMITRLSHEAAYGK